jgi:hypothetical protein
VLIDKIQETKEKISRYAFVDFKSCGLNETTISRPEKRNQGDDVFLGQEETKDYYLFVPHMTRSLYTNKIKVNRKTVDLKL